MNNHKYRQMLQQLGLEAQRIYDKTLITLCSGAIVLSVTYLSQLKEPRCRWLLFVAWITWSLSLSMMLFSYIVCAHALRKGLEQVDKGEEATGGPWSRLIVPANWAAGGLFLGGLVLVLIFVGLN